MAKRKYSAETKVKAVLEVLREEKQLGEVAAAYGISPNQLRNWKKEFLEKASRVFDESKREKEIREREKEIIQERDALYRTIGQVTFERDFLKKKGREAYGEEWLDDFPGKPL
jgi:transposase-like protein